MKIRIVIPLFVLLLACFPARTLAAPAAPGSYYLVLGDALSYGSTAPGVQADPSCNSPQAVGFVCIFYRYLKLINPQIQVKNLAIPDIDSCVMISGFGGRSPCTNPVLTAQGQSQIASPLDAAVQFLNDHPGQVNPITVNVGGGDLLPLLPNALTDPAGTAAKLPGVIRTYTANLDTILSRLRAAAGPNAQILVVNQYNPLGGIGSPPLPAGLPDIAKGAIENGLDGTMKAVAPKYNAVYVDIAAAFDANPGGAATLTFVPSTLASGDPTKMVIYPTVDGYALMGQTVIKASGYTVALSITAKLSSKAPKQGATVHLRGKTLPGVAVSAALKLPKAKSGDTLTGSADSSGNFELTFSAGKLKGKGTVVACATDPGGQKQCASKLSFTVK